MKDKIVKINDLSEDTQELYELIERLKYRVATLESWQHETNINLDQNFSKLDQVCFVPDRLA